MNKTTRKIVTVTLITGMIGSVSGCGTILYPERKGQSQGKIDVGIVALDAVGLLLWFVPGVIAFAVDFSTGAIYMPGGKYSQLTETEREQVVAADGSVDQEALNRLISEKSSAVKAADLSQLKVKSLSSEDELSAYFPERAVLYSSL